MSRGKSISKHVGQVSIPAKVSTADKGLFWPLGLTSLMLISLLHSPISTLPVWAAPGQDPQRQTVPTPTEVPETETEVPPGPGPAPTALPTSTAAPSPTSTAAPLPPTATSGPTTSVPAASPSVQLTLLPAPVEETPTVAQTCQPLEKTVSPLRGGELDLLVPCHILVKIPAGSVIEDTLLRLAPRLLTDAPPSDTWLQMRSVAFTLDALSAGGHPRSGFIFARPYTVTIRYDQSDVEIEEGGADKLTIAHYDAAAHKWIPLDSQVSPKERLVSAEFDQPGWLALVMDMTKGRPTRQPASTPKSLVSGTAVTTIAPTSVSSPPNQSEEASNPTCLLGIAGIPFLLMLAAGLYVAAGSDRSEFGEGD